MYNNVRETFPLYDTMIVSSALETMSKQPEQWFSTFQNAGAANEWNFFNIRNRASAGLPYNNQDTRDQLAWAYELYGINIHFFAPQIASQERQADTTLIGNREYIHTALWEADIPRHCGFELKINQDIRLEAASLMPGAGGGPVASGYTPLGLAGGGGFAHDVEGASILTAGGQSEEHVTVQFSFPRPIGIPRKCSIALTIKPNEYARRLITQLGGPYFYSWYDNQDRIQTTPVAFGIRCTLRGARLVQQRGALHA
jgi:hypothetical protein